LIAVVHTTDRVRFTAASSGRDDLVRQLAGYVRRRAADELWADDEARVRSLLVAGKREAAITHYFATVGQRWDKEWLVTSNLEIGALASRVLGPRLARATGTVYRRAAEERRVAEPRSAVPSPSPRVRTGHKAGTRHQARSNPKCENP